MGLFTRVGSAIKKVAQRAGSIIKTGIKKAAPVVLNIAQRGTSLLSHLPGGIGTVAGLANKGLGVVKDVISNIPNSKARDALNNVVNKGQTVVNNAQNTATNISNRLNTTAQPILRTAGNIAQTGMRLAN